MRSYFAAVPEELKLISGILTSSQHGQLHLPPKIGLALTREMPSAQALVSGLSLFRSSIVFFYPSLSVQVHSSFDFLPFPDLMACLPFLRSFFMRPCLFLLVTKVEPSVRK